MADRDARLFCGGSRHVARSAAPLLISLILLIAVGVGLRRLSTLMSSEDLAFVRQLAHHRSPTLTTLARSVSWCGRSVVLVPVAVVIAVGGRVLRWKTRGLTVLVGVLGAIIIQNIDKALVGRPRPPVAQLEQVSGTSFPSGHATEATAFFLVVLILLGRSGASRPVKVLAAVATTGLVAAVALSRVYLGVHYPSDIVAGVLLGGAWAAVTAAAPARGGALSGPPRA